MQNWYLLYYVELISLFYAELIYPVLSVTDIVVLCKTDISCNFQN